MEPLTIRYCRGESQYANARNITQTLDEFVAAHKQTAIRATKDGPWISHAILRDDSDAGPNHPYWQGSDPGNPKSCPKNFANANCLGVGRAHCFDFDFEHGGREQAEAIFTRLAERKIKHLRWSTHSYDGVTKFNFRVVVFTDKEMLLEDKSHTIEQIREVHRQIGLDLFDEIDDPACHRVVGLVFLPVCPSFEAPSFLQHHDGAVLQLDVYAERARVALAQKAFCNAGEHAHTEEKDRPTPGSIREALTFIKADDYKMWGVIGLILKREFGDDGFELWQEWSQTSPKFDANKIEAQWENLRPRDSNPVGIGTLFHHAKQGGWVKPEAAAPGKGAPMDGVKAVYETYDKVKLRAIKWLVPGWVPLGKVSLGIGRTKVGKSMFGIHMIARCTRGEHVFIDGPAGPACSAIYITGEDDAEDAAGPRLKAAGADLSKVIRLKHFDVTLNNGAQVQCGFRLDLAGGLANIITENPDAKLIVIDPFNAFVPDKTDTHRNAETRATLKACQELAEKYGIAVVILHHMKKGEKGANDVTDMSGGSNAIVEAVRSVFGFAREPGDTGRFMISTIAANYAKTGDAYLYEIEEVLIDGDTSSVPTTRIKIIQGEKPTMTLGEAMSGGPDKEQISALDDAKLWLSGELRDGDWHTVETLKESALKNGHSWKGAVRLASVALCVKKRPPGTKDGNWTWKLVDGDGVHRALAVDRAAGMLHGVSPGA